MTHKLESDSATIQDTYFSNFEDAKAQAEKQLFLDHAQSKLQLCFYDGEHQEENRLPNLINLPLSTIQDFFFNSDYRTPTKIFHLAEKEIKEKITESVNKRDKLLSIILKKIENQEISTQKKPRIYFSVDYNSKVVENIYRILDSTFKKNGWETFFDINDATSLMDDYRRARTIFEFRPNVVFTINRFRSNLINKNTFHFAWYMDPTLNLYDNSLFSVRDRDFFFYLIENFKDALIKKGVPQHKLQKQSFACDPFFNLHSKIYDKEEKIVFIGNDYFKVCDPTYKYAKNIKIVNLVTSLFESGKIHREKIEAIATELLDENLIERKEHFEMFIFPAVVRVQVLKWLCQVSPIPVEIYGNGWDVYPEMAPYYKGNLTGKQAVKKVCLGAKYSLLAHPEYYYQQRLLESAACGSIPVIFIGSNNREKYEHNDSSLTFKTKDELKKLLMQEPALPPDFIAKDMQYNRVVKSVEEKIFELEPFPYHLTNTAEVLDV